MQFCVTGAWCARSANLSLRLGAGWLSARPQRQQPEENGAPEKDAGGNGGCPKHPDPRGALKIAADPTADHKASNEH